jgi:hypothetical protein
LAERLLEIKEITATPNMAHHPTLMHQYILMNQPNSNYHSCKELGWISLLCRPGSGQTLQLV